MDVPGIATLSGGLFLVVFGLIKAQTWGWLASQTLGVILAGVVALAVFVVIELRTEEPLLPLHLFANRSLSIGTAVVVINFFALFGTLFFMTLFLQNVQGMSPVEAGVRTLPLSAALMVTAPLSGFLTEKFGPRPAMAGGLAAVAAALVLAEHSARRFRIRRALARVPAAGCRHRPGPHRQFGRHRRQRAGRRRRYRRRPAEHRGAVGRGARHDDPGFDPVQPGGLGARRRADRGRGARPGGRGAARRQRACGPRRDASGARCAGRPRPRRSRTAAIRRSWPDCTSRWWWPPARRQSARCSRCSCDAAAERPSADGPGRPQCRPP